jgi:hypothetical protein
MAGALGVVITNTVPVSGQHAQPVYVDDSLPIVGPSQAVVIAGSDIPQLGGPPIAVRSAPIGTPALGPAIPIYVVSGYLPSAYGALVQSLGPIAYWPMDEAAGAVAVDRSGNGRNGAYTAVTLGQPGIGDGRTAPSFDGTTSYNNVFGASLAAAFNSALGSIAIWFRLPENVDATNRFAINLFTDANNRVVFDRTAGTTMRWRYIAGGTTETLNITVANTAWHHFAVTWNKAGDQAIGYLDGVQQGAAQTGLGVWAGAIGQALIGASTAAPTFVWSGTLAHAAVWNSALSAAQILTLAQVS